MRVDFFQFLRVTDGHEFYKNMGLPEITEAPAQGRNHHGHEGCGAGGVWEEGEEIPAFPGQNVQCRYRAAKGNHAGYGNVNDGEEHHGALDEVCKSYSGESAEECIEYHDKGPQQESMKVGNAEDGIEQLPRSHEAGGSIDDEEQDDKEGADEAKAILLIFEPVGQVVRDGEAVIGYFRVVTESLGNENPVGPGTDDEADAGPKGGKTMEVSVSRKAHEHPAAHVRCFSAHGGEPRSQLPVP